MTMENNLSLAGKVAVVTGGIGAASVRSLAAARRRRL